MNRKWRNLFFLLALLLLIVGSGILWAHLATQLDRDNTALIAAIKRNDTGAVLQLLDRGADANARDRANRPSLRERFSQLWDRMLGRRSGDSGLFSPTAILVLLCPGHGQGIGEISPPENVAILKALLDRGANPNIQDLADSTPLLYACAAGYTDSAQLLLEHGAGVNVKNCWGETLLAVAKQSKNPTIIRLLKQHGAK